MISGTNLKLLSRKQKAPRLYKLLLHSLAYPFIAFCLTLLWIPWEHFFGYLSVIWLPGQFILKTNHFNTVVLVFQLYFHDNCTHSL